MSAGEARHSLGLCLSTEGDARFLGHLDFAKLVERSLRRSGLPVQSTRGFNPHYRVSYPDALPLGLASTGEWITVVMNEDLPPDTVQRRLTPALPDWVTVVDVRRGGAPEPPDAMTYRVEVTSGAGSLAQALTELLDRDGHLVDDPRGRAPHDVRAWLADARVDGDLLVVRLVRSDDRLPRPGLLLEALKALAAEAGLAELAFGVVTKQPASALPRGDAPWHDANATPQPEVPRASSC